MKFTRILLGIVICFVLLLSVFSQDEWADVDYNELNDLEKEDYLRGKFGMDVTSGLGNVEVEGDFATVRGAVFELKGAKFSGGGLILKGKELVEARGVKIEGAYDHRGAIISGEFSLVKKNELTLEEGGEMSLGSGTSGDLKITAREGTTIEVTDPDKPNGYTGVISTEGVVEIKSFNNQIVKVFSGTVALVKGKIRKADEVEALAPVKGVFDGVPEDMAVSMRKGRVEGNKITGTDVCIDEHCFHSKDAFNIEAAQEVLKIKGEGIKYRGTGKEKRMIDSKNGATLDIKTKRWDLSAGTRVTEIKAGEPSSVVKVSKDAAYFPEHKRDICGGVEGSCVAIDEYNSMRVKAEDGNEIKVNSFKLMPSLVVDKIVDDESKVVYVEHYLRDEKKQLIGLKFSKEKGVDIFPPGNLKNMRTKVIFDYEDEEGKVKAFELNTLGKGILIEGQTVGYFDETVAENYYATKLGDVIKKEDKEDYEAFMIEKLGLRKFHDVKKLYEEEKRFEGLNQEEKNEVIRLGKEELNKFSDEEKDFLMLLMHYNPKNKEEIGLWADGIEIYAKNLPPEIDRGVLFRDAIKFERKKGEKLWKSRLIDIYDTIEIASENDLLIEKLTKLHDEGKFSNEMIINFNNQVMSKIKADTPEEIDRYISLLEKLPRDSQEIEKLGIQSVYLKSFIDAYGRKDKDIVFLKGIEGLIEEGITTEIPKNIGVKTAAEFLAGKLDIFEEELTTHLDEPPANLPKTIKIDGKTAELVWDETRGKWDYYQEGRHKAVYGSERIVYGEEKEVWKELELDLPAGWTKEELPIFLEAMNNLEKAKGGFDPKEENKLRTGMELWEKAPSLIEKLENWDAERSQLSYYFVSGEKLESPKKIGEGMEILKALEEASRNPRISEETKEALKKYREKNGEWLGKAVNQLHNQPKERKRLVKILPDAMKIEILSQPLEGLGEHGGVYRSSIKLVFKDLVEKAGGENRFIDFLKEKDYNLEEEKTVNVLRMLGACGQLGKVIPEEEGKRRRIYNLVLQKFTEESFSRTGNVINSILENPKFSKEFTETLLKEYEKAEGEEKDFLQYSIRQNDKYFNIENARAKDALENPSQNVLEVEEKLKIPVDKFIENSEKRKGVPVLKAAMPITDVEDDPGMEASFERFKKVGGGFKLVGRMEKGYVLERRGSVVNEAGEKVPVIFRMEVFSNPEERMEKIRDDPSYFMVASKGHSFSSEIVWNQQEGYKNDIPRIGYIGSCTGSNDISEEELTKIHRNTAFFATPGTTTARLNDGNIRNTFKGLEKGYKDYRELAAYVKEKAGKSEQALLWNGPKDFFVDDLKKS